MTQLTNYVSIQRSAVSGQRSAVSFVEQALALAFWPFGHATRTATLREWPRCANEAVT
ncbi:MAG: hypothetical protein F6K63_04760 [Moorea sp. SIO1G6]|uniref:Uncharacterized protein n=1 Tax=Moorena producens (strain JHB) TaxID=1454205 RepID=A0A9Q9UVI4_MOOP1|nr:MULTISPECIES: hypothetical protein [Moorena]NET63743.1 hypothetical protein [Moorena sp. SIO1G6]WAN68870.1 hypothetical protein BJP36_41650 [Moorena producens JHB]